MKKLLEYDRVEISYNGRPAVQAISVDLAAGGGAAVVASCHSDEKGESRIMREAKRRGTFGIFYGVSKDGAGRITLLRDDGRET